MKQALSGKGNGGRGAHSGIIPEAVASCGLPLNLSTIAGIVYKDEDGDGLYGACLDVPMRDALVSAWYEKQLVDACRADQEGRYSLHVPAGRDHTLRAWLPPPDECYDPRLRLWGFFSTVEAVPAKFRCAAGSLDLPVRYRMLNYGPRDFTWELWHRGPVFDRENVVLVHGFRFPVASRRGRCDKQFGRLDDLLQTGDDQYNVWQFEYADRVRGTPDTVATYSARLHEAMSLVGRLTGRPRCSIIAYSLGGIIARKCIADGAAAKVDRLLTVATPHMGTMRFEPLSLSWPERMVPRAGLELRPDSRLLWDLNTNAESSTVPEFASIGGYAWGNTDGLIEMSSASLVKCNPDGSIARKYCFAGVKRSHRNINRVSNKDDEVFRLVRGFLRGGIAGMNAPGEPGKRRAWSNLTFSLKRKPGNRFIYPHIYVENTRRHYWGYKVCSQGARLRDGSYIFSVQIHPDDEDDVRIYYARGKYATVRVRSGQSTIVTQPMGADIPGFRFRSLVPVWIRLSNNEEGT